MLAVPFPPSPFVFGRIALREGRQELFLCLVFPELSATNRRSQSATFSIHRMCPIRFARFPRNSTVNECLILEAQQRYFSYRAKVVAIVSQNYLVLVFLGYRTIIARYVAKWGIAQMCLCETKCQGGGIAPFWGSANLP